MDIFYKGGVMSEVLNYKLIFIFFFLLFLFFINNFKIYLDLIFNLIYII